MTYIGVCCKTTNCPTVIGLQEYSDAIGDATDNPSTEHPFIVKCDTCGVSHSYDNDDLSLFEG
jgi:hypothetical protein